ncbi:MAG: bifunctional oligoribonuclease/PAP phosphatase NrnA [Gemmatimonadetes bacterium]|nr:bifunctional oligoribonuclease/PAP phosphatase NrnA [Gemmatimonadota bacterium]MYC69553.1 bifunctional oligoribonuclease/PAP phosphatase NrnA [Gemmatimonadota bacterium]
MDLKLRTTRAFIEEADDFLLTTHVNSDADGLGACMAWVHLLRSLGKRADIGLPEPPAGQCSFLAGWDGVRHFADLDLSRYRYAIVADCPSLDRIGPVRPGLSPDIRLLNIDHHQDNECFGAVNIVEEVSSTCELLYHLAGGLGYEVDAVAAAQLYAGILFDTGGFRFSLTSATTFEVAADLVRRGARLDAIAQDVFGNKSLGSVKQRGQAIESLVLRLGGRVAVLHLDLAAMSAGEPDEAVNYGLMIQGVEVAVLLKERAPGCYRVSLRSRDKVDVSQVAGTFGGGGHARAAGLELTGVPQDIVEDILTEISRYLDK